MRKILLLGIGLLAAACSGTANKNVRESGDESSPSSRADDEVEDEREEIEEQVPLDNIPAIVLEAALAAVPGLVPEEAEREIEDGAVVYCIEGQADGVWFDVDVTPEGEVIELESGEEDDDD